MFRWLRERRQRREREASKAREQLRRKAGLRPSDGTFLESLVPDDMRDGVAERFALQLVAQEVAADRQREAHAKARRADASESYQPSPPDTPLVFSAVLTGSDSHSHGHGHDHGSSHFHSYDSGSSYSSDGGGGW